MDRVKHWILEYRIVLLFALAKLGTHLLTATQYGFQRDAYLYLAQARHLDWGYFSTPPLLAFVTRVHTLIWGDSLLAIRLLPALVGTLNIFLVGWMIKKLKGGNMAQLIGLTAVLLSPAFLRPAVLLQPVIFNHLSWLLAAMVLFQMVRKQDPRLVLWLIPVLGLGWMNKYSIVFYGMSLLVAMIISRHRKLLWSWYLLITVIGGFFVILPNLIWQFQHNWPVFSHMAELQESQLGNVLLKDFLFAQLFMHLPALPVWAGGLVLLLFNKKFRDYRLFAWAFLITLLLIIVLRGKFYYTIAAYTMLMVFGGIAWERWSPRPRRWIAWLVLALILSNGLYTLPFSLPIYKPSRMAEYGRKKAEQGLQVMLKWEDGEVHDLPQDYADMVGWDELGEKVWSFYESLPDSVRLDTWIFGEFYGCAGAVDYFKPDKRYPEVYSFNDAYKKWVPRKPSMKYMIYVGYSDRVSDYFQDVRLIGSVEHPYFRERGLPIWFGSFPQELLYEDWEAAWQMHVVPFQRER